MCNLIYEQPIYQAIWLSSYDECVTPPMTAGQPDPELRGPDASRVSSGSARPGLLDALDWESRRIAAFLGILTRAVASQMKLNTTDVETLGVLAVVGTVTPTRLASLLAMRTGSMTLVIDRLERAGFVRRVRDTKDRRSVMVEIVEQRSLEMAAFYAPLQQRGAEIAQRYSDSELALIVDYVTRSNDMLNDLVTALAERSATEPRKAPPSDVTAPGTT
jgi:DNA-binding MarR family transcriptional regulator